MHQCLQCTQHLPSGNKPCTWCQKKNPTLSPVTSTHSRQRQLRYWARAGPIWLWVFAWTHKSALCDDFPPQSTVLKGEAAGTLQDEHEQPTSHSRFDPQLYSAQYLCFFSASQNIRNHCWFGRDIDFQQEQSKYHTNRSASHPHSKAHCVHAESWSLMNTTVV